MLVEGYRVRGTLRDLARGAEIEAALAGWVDVADLSFVEADLMADDGWAAAVADCRYVVHLASPLPKGRPKHEDELIVRLEDRYSDEMKRESAEYIKAHGAKLGIETVSG